MTIVVERSTPLDPSAGILEFAQLFSGTCSSCCGLQNAHTEPAGERSARLHRSCEDRMVREMFGVMMSALVVEMGIALYRLAGRLDRPEFGDLDRRAARIDQRERPTELMLPFQEP